jgi:hypothetical protein
MNKQLYIKGMKDIINNNMFNKTFEENDDIRKKYYNRQVVPIKIDVDVDSATNSSTDSMCEYDECNSDLRQKRVRIIPDHIEESYLYNQQVQIKKEEPPCIIYTPKLEKKDSRIIIREKNSQKSSQKSYQKSYQKSNFNNDKKSFFAKFLNSLKMS